MLPKRTSAGSGLIHPTELDASFSELTPDRIDYEMNAEAFIHAPVKEQEFEWLQALLDADILFPPYFLKSLVRPLVNIEFYKKNGDKENEAYWEKQKLPYINKEVCQVIANSHPEAAIETPSFITKRAVNEFWTKHVEDLDAKTLTTYFLAFPESVLSSYMADDIFVTEKVLCHAPNIMKDTTAAWQFISRNPKYIFSLPWQYQREGLLVGGSINIADLKANVDKIINTELREKIVLAFDIPFTADEIEENTENDI